MVWIAEKKVFHHVLDMGFERVDVPIRVKFEFKLADGCLVPDSLSKEILYNRKALLNRYPDLDRVRLERTLEEQADEEILAYLREAGFLEEAGGRL